MLLQTSVIGHASSVETIIQTVMKKGWCVTIIKNLDTFTHECPKNKNDKRGCNGKKK